MLFFGKRSDDVSCGVLIDISSGSIGFGLVVSKRADAHPELIYTHREPLRLHAHTPEVTQNTRSVREALLASALFCIPEALNALRAYDPALRADQLFITAASPWAHTVARTVQHETETPIKITKALLETLMRQAEEAIFASVLEEAHLKARELEIVEKATVDITVNEYPVHAPVGIKARSLGLTHIAGLVPADILRTVDEVRDKLLPETATRVHTSMLATYCVMRDLFPQTNTLCIIDVTGESTEFGLVEHNTLVANAYVPHGSNALIRTMSHAQKRPVADILTEIRELAESKKSQADAFEPFTTKYVTAVREHIAALTETRPLPERVFIFVQEPFVAYFSECIEAVIREATEKRAQVQVVAAEALHDVMSTLDESNRDVHLAFSARFFHKLQGCAEIQEE